MPKPLRSDDTRPQDIQFAHFGVLNDGKRSKGAAVTSIVINGLILLIIVLLGLVVKTNPKMAKQLTELTMPPEPPPPPVVKRPPPPPPPKPLPTPPRITPPKTVEPPPPDIKPIEVPVPKPIVSAPAPPKAITPPPAPVKVDLANKAVAIKNNDLHPSPVRMGSETNPISPTGPAVSNINLGNAGARTNASNTGSGPRASAVQLGNGNPNGTNMNGTSKGNSQIVGVNFGTKGANGPIGSSNRSNAPVNVQIQGAPQPQNAVHAAINPLTAAAPPKVIYKPAPVYTAEARSLHLEGNVSVKIKVLASGAVEVEAITHSLGHGLDESARQAVLGTRFKPAVDSNGHPVDWEGVVLVNFQLG